MRIWDGLLDGLAYVATALVLAVTVAVIYEVVSRYFFNHPTIWVVDFTEYALVYITFLGAPWALREGAHIRIELLVERLGQKPQLVLSGIMSLLAAAVAGVLMWQGVQETVEAYLGGYAELRSWRVPRWRLFLPIPVGSFALMIEFLRQAWRDFHRFKSALEPGIDGASGQRDSVII